MANELKGTTSLVTGATSSLGQATAAQLAKLGSQVVLVGAQRDKLDQIVEPILANGDSALVIEADITSDQEAKRAVKETMEAFGRLDVLVNNASVMLLSPATDASLEQWKQMIAVNVSGLLYITHEALPHLIAAAKVFERKVADVINLGAALGPKTLADAAVYSMTKSGVSEFSKALRDELKNKRVRVSVVEPGPVEPYTLEQSRLGVKDGLKKVFSRVDQLKPEDVAETIGFMVTRPRHVLIDEVVITPAEKIV